VPRIIPYTRAQSGRLVTSKAEQIPSTLDLNAAWGLYDKQVRFVRCRSLFSLFLGGVGSGKSYALTAWVLHRALANPGAVGALLGRTGNDLQTVLLPTLFAQLDQIQDACGVNLLADYDKGNAKITLVNGCSIYFRPYNRIAKIRGLTLTFAAADEVEWSEADPEEIWSVFTGRLRGKGPMPGLAFATSPNGLRGITKRFVDAQRGYFDARAKQVTTQRGRLAQYHVVTSSSFHNPYLPDHYYDVLKSMSKRRYQQEVEGKVLRPTNTVWSLETRHLVEWRWRSHADLQRVYGVDWGTQDHHVSVMIQVDNAGRWTVADELVCDGIPRGQFLKRLLDWIDGHSKAHAGSAPALIACDRAVPGENSAVQRYYGQTPVRWMEKKKEQKVKTGIEYVRDMMDPQAGEPTLRFARSLAQKTTGVTAPMVPAMRGYCYHLDDQKLPTDVPKKDNLNDHICDALRYAVSASVEMSWLHGGRNLLMYHRDDGASDAGKGYGVGNSGAQV
tara:strand:+ start:465 stop:1970 length:1506 start_codon:yes stop_codon:yes gene_type:complete